MTTVAPARANSGDYASLLLALRDQFVRQGVPEQARNATCWLQADAMLRKVALDSFLSDPGLMKISIDGQLQQVRQANTGRFASADPLLLIQAYAQADGNLKSFRDELMQIPTKEPIDWKSKATSRAIHRLYQVLDNLAAQGIQVTYSGRYKRATWGFNVSSAYYPFSRSVVLYVIGSSKCPGSGRSKTTVLNLKGTVEVYPSASGRHAFSATLDEITFHCQGCQLSMKGRWTDRFTPDRGGRVSLANVLTLSIKGTDVTGHLVQEVVSTDVAGNVSSGQLTYRIRGTMDPSGNLTATLAASPQVQALRWMQHPPTDEVRGSLTGVVRNAIGSGELTLKGFPTTLDWQARAR